MGKVSIKIDERDLEIPNHTFGAPISKPAGIMRLRLIGDYPKR